MRMRTRKPRSYSPSRSLTAERIRLPSHHFPGFKDFSVKGQETGWTGSSS